MIVGIFADRIITRIASTHMIRIGILSDTHGFVHPRIFDFFGGVDEIWHAGDIGTSAVLDQLRELKPCRAVYGNIDGNEIRMILPEIQVFAIGQVRVMITHIGGYPGHFPPGIRRLLEEERPNLFVCGHSHILRVGYDQSLGVLCINPGAAGKYGMHKSITAVRLVIDGSAMKDLEVLDIPRKT